MNSAIKIWQKAATNRHYITPTDHAYPVLLNEFSSKSKPLFIEGALDLLTQPAIAIVGSRNPSKMGYETAILFAHELAKVGFVITSGIAMGIDTASHLGALQATGKTIAVLGCGIDLVYPKQNRALYQRIINEGGACVSEFPLGTPPMARNFPMRNHIIAGMSLGVLVVEAALRSGSLITARLALEGNRELFAIPGSIHNPLSKGCHHLLRNGATLVESAQDIYAELRHFFHSPQSVSSTLTLPTPKLHQARAPNVAYEKLAKIDDLLVKCVGYEPTPLDVVAARSGLSAAAVSAQLLELELRGIVDQCPEGYMRKI